MLATVVWCWQWTSLAGIYIKYVTVFNQHLEAWWQVTLGHRTLPEHMCNKELHLALLAKRQSMHASISAQCSQKWSALICASLFNSLLIAPHSQIPLCAHTQQPALSFVHACWHRSAHCFMGCWGFFFVSNNSYQKKLRTRTYHNIEPVTDTSICTGASLNTSTLYCHVDFKFSPSI